MQVLSKTNHEILLNFSKASDLMIHMNYILQNKCYNFKKILQETKQDKIKIFKSDKSNQFETL